MKKNIGILGGFGLISGLLSYYVAIDLRESLGVAGTFWNDAAVWYIPGMLWGVAVALYFLLWRNVHAYANLLIWILVSLLSYTAAVKTTVVISQNIHQLPFALVVAGLVGAALMLIGFHVLLSKLSPSSYVLLALLGGVLGLGFLVGNVFPHIQGAAFLFLYVVWQTGMCLGLGFVVDKRELT